MLVLDAEAAAGVGPLDVVVDVADDAAGPTLDAAFVGEDDAAVSGGNVAVGGAAIDALLALALEADVVVDDADVGAARIDVVGVEGELALDGGGIEDAGPGRLLGNDAH